MEIAAVAFVASILTTALSFFVILARVLVGAFTGLAIGLLFGGPIQYTLGQFGVHGVELWQLGATLAFVGSFFISTTATTKVA